MLKIQPKIAFLLKIRDLPGLILIILQNRPISAMFFILFTFIG
jgi:hypothetical protein